MNDGSRKELQRQMVQVRAEVDVKRQEAMIVADNVYANPRNAVKNMMSFSGKHGDAKLVAKLEESPSFFGTLKGHLGSGNALSLQGVRDRSLSKEQVKLLPELVKSALDADNKLLAIERALDGKGPGLGREKSKDGPDFL